MIEETNKILGSCNRPFEDFSCFDEDLLPTNSDVVIILSKYLNCLEKLRSNNIVRAVNSWFWLVDGKKSTIITSRPKKSTY